MTWTPLEIPPSADPETAFMCGAQHSHDSQVILLAWVKGVGWCGARGVPNGMKPNPMAPDTILLRINDTIIAACDRPELASLGPKGITNA